MAAFSCRRLVIASPHHRRAALQPDHRDHTPLHSLELHPAQPHAIARPPLLTTVNGARGGESDGDDPPSEGTVAPGRTATTTLRSAGTIFIERHLARPSTAALAIAWRPRLLDATEAHPGPSTATAPRML